MPMFRMKITITYEFLQLVGINEANPMKEVKEIRQSRREVRHISSELRKTNNS